MFKSIYIGGNFLCLVREKATRRPQKDAQVAVCRCSAYHAAFVECQYQRCPHYCLRQGTIATLVLGNAAYHLQRVQFVASQLSVFAALPRAMDRSNAKLSEGIYAPF